MKNQSKQPDNQPITPRVRFGMLGISNFGAKRRERLRKSGAFEMVGAVARREQAFVEAEAEEGKPLKRYASLKEMLADPEIEAVVISTPASMHVREAMLAARAGKAVFCEKPLGPDFAACEELVEYCEQHNIPHGHGFDQRFLPHWQEVKRIVDSGKLGRIVSASAATMHTGGLSFPPDNWRFTAADNPGGPLFQCGIHKVDLLRFLLGDGRWLAGVVQKNITASETDDSYVLLGAFGGVPVTLHSHYVASYRHTIEIYGTKGDLFISEHPTKLEYKATDPVTGAESLEDITATIPPTDAEGDSLRDFARAVREKRQPVMNAREGLITLNLVFEAVAIAKELSETQEPVHDRELVSY